MVVRWVLTAIGVWVGGVTVLGGDDAVVEVEDFVVVVADEFS